LYFFDKFLLLVFSPEVELLVIVDGGFCRRFRLSSSFLRAMYDWRVPEGGETLDMFSALRAAGGGLALTAGVPSGVFFAVARNFLSIFSSSVMTHVLFIPASAHFLSRQA
jgi:hypothetical protein